MAEQGRIIGFICEVCGEEIEVAPMKDDHHYVYQGMAVSQYVCLKCGKRPFEEVWKALEKGASYIGDKKAGDILDKKVKMLKLTKEVRTR